MSTDSDPPTNQTASPATRLRFALEQFQEEALLYNRAVGSYNTHLDNHRDRRDLHDLPFRDPITAHDAYDAALEGDPAAIDTILTHLIDEAHLDSQLQRHPRTYPIHDEAVEHLETARAQLVGTLEEALQHIENDDG